MSAKPPLPPLLLPPACMRASPLQPPTPHLHEVGLQGEPDPTAALAAERSFQSGSSTGRRLLSGGRRLHTFRWWRQLLGGQAVQSGTGAEPRRSSAASQPAVQAFDGASNQPAAQRLVAVRPPAASTAAVITAAMRNLDSPAVDGSASQPPSPMDGPGGAAANGGSSQQPNGAAANIANGAAAGGPAGGIANGAAAVPAAVPAAAAAGAAPEGGQPPFNGACPPTNAHHHTAHHALPACCQFCRACPKFHAHQTPPVSSHSTKDRFNLARPDPPGTPPHPRCAAAGQTAANQKSKLLLLKSSIDPGKTLNWRAGSDVCTQWQGVKCNAQGLVQEM